MHCANIHGVDGCLHAASQNAQFSVLTFCRKNSRDDAIGPPILQKELRRPYPTQDCSGEGARGDCVPNFSLERNALLMFPIFWCSFSAKRPPLLFRTTLLPHRAPNHNSKTLASLSTKHAEMLQIMPFCSSRCHSYT